MKKRICIVIPTFNRISSLRILLTQIRGQEMMEDAPIQILIVDDGCTDGTAEALAAEFPEVSVLHGEGGWWWTRSTNEGMKYGLQHFDPDYFLILNDDSQIAQGYLQALLHSASEAGPGCIIGSISVTDRKPYKVSFAGVRTMNWLYLKKKNYFRSFELLENIPAAGLFPTYALNGRGTLVESKVIQDLGYLNEASFPQYGSDDDLALRAWKKGYQVLISYSCRVYDQTTGTSKGSALRKDGVGVFVKSFFVWNSVNYIPKQIVFFYTHGIKVLIPFYLVKYILGTSYAYFFKYKKLKNEL